MCNQLHQKSCNGSLFYSIEFQSVTVFLYLCAASSSRVLLYSFIYVQHRVLGCGWWPTSVCARRPTAVHVRSSSWWIRAFCASNLPGRCSVRYVCSVSRTESNRIYLLRVNPVAFNRLKTLPSEGKSCCSQPIKNITF